MRRLDFRKKQIILWIVTILTLYVAYQLSFKKAIAAFSVNDDLKKDSYVTYRQPMSYVLIEQKNEFYKSIIKGYKVKKESRENRLWQSLSEMAIGNKVNISYIKEKVESIDSTAISKGIVSETFTFTGSYFNLVKLLDTISKSDGIGRIYSLELGVQSENELKANGARILVLKLNGITY